MKFVLLMDSYQGGDISNLDVLETVLDLVRELAILCPPQPRITLAHLAQWVTCPRAVDLGEEGASRAKMYVDICKHNFRD